MSGRSSTSSGTDPPPPHPTLLERPLPCPTSERSRRHVATKLREKPLRCRRGSLFAKRFTRSGEVSMARVRPGRRSRSGSPKHAGPVSSFPPRSRVGSPREPEPPPRPPTTPGMGARMELDRRGDPAPHLPRSNARARRPLRTRPSLVTLDRPPQHTRPRRDPRPPSERLEPRDPPHAGPPHARPPGLGPGDVRSRSVARLGPRGCWRRYTTYTP
jgi:hypothetical protein